MTELSEINGFLYGKGQESRLIGWCTDVRIYRATSRSELDVDNHLAKQHKIIPGASGYLAELWRRAEPGNGVSCQPRTSGLHSLGKGPPGYTVRRYTGLLQVGPVHGPHRPRVSYSIYVENSMENIVANADDVLFM